MSVAIFWDCEYLKIYTALLYSFVDWKRVFMEKVYRSSKWWEVKDCGESVSKLMIGGGGENNYKKLYAVLSCMGVFNFCTCILICLVCIVASFKLSCV